MPAAIMSCHRGTALLADPPAGKRRGGSSPSSSPVEIAMIDEPGIDQAGGTQMHAALDEIQRAIQHRRSRHQNHARANRDKAQRRTQVVADRQSADNAGEQRRTEWLQEDVGAVLRQAAAKNSAGACADEYEHRRCRCWTPKITANAAAPAAAASVNSHVGAGGACEIGRIVSLADSGVTGRR